MRGWASISGLLHVTWKSHSCSLFEADQSAMTTFEVVMTVCMVVVRLDFARLPNGQSCAKVAGRVACSSH